MLSEAQFKEIKHELDTCQRPLFFFHDDADGVCSFLQFYRYADKGKGLMVKAVPNIGDNYLHSVQSYDPDKIFILDIAMVEQSFLDSVHVPVIWIDHHEPVERTKVKYYNPMLSTPKSHICVSALCYLTLKKDLWIGAAGTVGDWQLHPFMKEFAEQYPSLLDKNITKPEEALFSSGIGRLSRIISFMLKGTTSEAMSSIKVFARIEDPYEILDQKSSRGRYIIKRFSDIDKHYAKLYKEATASVKKDPLLLFTYKDAKYSFTGDLSNELLFRYPDKVILLGREKSGEMRCSLRSAKTPILPVLKKALEGVNGYGGGHPNACGCAVKVEDFEKFIEHLRKAL
ncbi:MAG TPA: DHH family phosphoesterase [Candidatus Nanoarchaeia archaeon]|nr:DHH family phosphoesterase [Candidatus Nanoarchaeia archaeon]